MTTEERINQLPACKECGAVQFTRYGHFAECSQFLEDAKPPTDDFCDDCQGYTHMPWCSEYEEPSREVCAQCEANAKHNEAAGYHELAAECRDYCRRGHKDASEQPASATGREQSQLFPRYSFAVVTGRYKILDNRSDGPVRIAQIATADGEQEARTIVNALNAQAETVATPVYKHSDLQGMLDQIAEAYRDQHAQLTSLREQNERLREALQFQRDALHDLCDDSEAMTFAAAIDSREDRQHAR